MKDLQEFTFNTWVYKAPYIVCDSEENVKSVF